jgi:hypothetical protein
VLKKLVKMILRSSVTSRKAGLTLLTGHSSLPKDTADPTKVEHGDWDENRGDARREQSDLEA